MALAASLVMAGCAREDASPTEQACNRLAAIGRRTASEGELPVAVYREEFAAAWTEAARDPNSPIAAPIDRVIGIVDASPNGYLLPADQQHLIDQLGQVARMCEGLG